MLSMFKRTKEKITPPTLTAVEIPESTFSLRSEIAPHQILSAKTMRKRGHLKPLLGIYRIYREEDDSVASACDTRQEALKAAHIAFSTDGLTDTQISYFNGLIKRFGARYCGMLLDMKLTSTLFRQIEYDIEDGFYTPVDYIEYPDADLRLVNNKPIPFHEGKPIDINLAKFISLYRDDHIFYSIMRYHVFQIFAINNWAQFTETFGKPPRIAKYRPGTTQTEKEQLWEMLQNFGTDLAAMVSENVTIDFADFVNKTGSADLYDRLCEYCDDRITRRILGNTLTTKAVSTGGSYAQAQVHEMVRTDILAGDCRDLDIFLTEHFSMLNAINFGGGEIDVIVQPKTKVNLMERIQIDNMLWNNIGIDFPEDYWHQTYGVPAPEKKQ